MEKKKMGKEVSPSSPLLLFFLLAEEGSEAQVALTYLLECLDKREW